MSLLGRRETAAVSVDAPLDVRGIYVIDSNEASLLVRPLPH